MKKVLCAIAAVLMAGIMYVQPALAGPAIDEEHTAGGANTTINSSLGSFAQTFKMHYSRLDKVEIELINVGANKTATVAIKHRTGLNWDEGNVAIVSNQAIGDGWNTFNFPDITVGTTENDSYGIWVTCNDTVYWKYKSGPSVYDRGFAIWQNQDKLDWDWNFKVWGYDPTEIIEEQTNPGSDQTPEQTGITTPASTTPTGEAPAAKESAAIAKPSELTATYSDGVQLAWKASATTDITGYIVFRSEEKGKGYTKLSDVAKTKLDYTDKTAAASKTYYYIVRAVKGVEQSASSNEASITVPENAAPTTPQNFKVKGTGSSYIAVEWDKNPETNISGYELVISKGTETIETVLVETTATSYVFKNLAPASEYAITIVAKNSNDKQSEPETLTSSTTAELPPVEAAGFQMNTLSWVLLGGAIILFGLLIYLIAKRRREKRQI